MPIDIDAAAEQLAGEISSRLDAIGDAFIRPGWPATDIEITTLIDQASERTVRELASDDPHTAAGAALTVVTTLWPAGVDVPLDWWATPLGTLTMLAGNDVVSQAMAARALGVSPQRVAQLVAKGRLATVGDHVSTVSLRARLGLR